MPKLKSFITPDGQLTQDDIIAQVKEMKRPADLKAEKEKSEEYLKRIMNPANIKAHAQKIAEYEAKRTKMLNEYNDCINHKVDELPITKISYRVNSFKEATIRITRANDPLNAKALGIPPPHKLSTFGVSINDKKRKRSLVIQNEVFENKDIVVGGMHRNQVPPPGVEGRKELVIREPESRIFFYNGNFDLRGSPEAEEIFAKLELTIEAREDAAKARIIVKDNLDGLGQHIEQPQTYSSQRHCQGSRRSLEDILVSWDGYQLVCRRNTMRFYGESDVTIL
nr:hypothetical protein [Tanacetum cinerariifolium]